jgi:hypothetical protein
MPDMMGVSASELRTLCVYYLQLISSASPTVVDFARIFVPFGLSSKEKVMCASPAAGSSLILLWAGEDPAFFQTLTDSLNAAGIPSRNMALGADSIAPAADPLPIDWKPRFGFEVAVLSADMTAAKQILEKLLLQEPQDLEIPAQPLATDEERPLTDDTEEHPKVEIWNGGDDGTSEFLTAALQENEIPMHIETPDGQTHIYVSAANEERAREIVREITLGRPPQ